MAWFLLILARRCCASTGPARRTEEFLHRQNDSASWAADRARLAEVFKTKRFDEWRESLEGTETCFAPVLTLADAPAHAHHVERGTFVEVDGVMQPAPAPRFSRTPPGPPRPPAAGTETVEEVVQRWTRR